MLTYSVLPNNGSTIRLLNINPGSFCAPVECCLFHAPLATSSSFEALSYAWGDPRVATQITVNSSPLAVTTDLALALRHLRDPAKPRTMWIDALCLNQVDEAEKAAQIPLMHLIYRRAFRVVVWLGPSGPDSSLAFDYIRNLHSLLVDPARCAEVHYTVHHEQWPIVLYPLPPYSQLEERGQLAFYRLLARPWWQRAWIAPEVSCGREVLMQCGGDSVPWEYLQMAMTLCRNTHHAIMQTGLADKGSGDESWSGPWWPADVGNNALSLGWDRERLLSKSDLGIFEKGTRQITAVLNEESERSFTDLSWVLLINRGRKCSLAHDRIYSVLGLAGAKFRAGIRQLYSGSIEELYCSIVENYARATDGCLDIIMQSQHGVWHDRQRGQRPHPTWAPDWQHILRSAPFHQNDQLQMPWDKFVDRIDQAKTPHFAFCPSKLELTITSYYLGCLKTVALEFDHLLKPDCAYYGEHKTKLCRSSAGTPPPFRGRQWWEFREDTVGTALLEPLLKRIPGDDPLWNRSLDAWLFAVAWRLRFAETRHWLPKACDWTLEDWPQVAEEKRFPESEELFSAVDYIVASRTLGILDDGRLVLAPDFTEEGDLVYILAGCSNAAVLRKRDDGSIMFLGDCYVMGLSDCAGEGAEARWDKIVLS